MQVGEEVSRRVRVEQKQLDQDRTAMNHTWNAQTENGVIAPIPKDMYQPEEVEESDYDSELEAAIPSLLPRRKRRVKTPHK